MKIITDCGAEFSSEELQTLGITQAPLFINFPQESINSAEIGPDDFYDRLEAMAPKIPTTSQPSSTIFEKIYHELILQDKDLLSIHISSGLSGTINSAQVASQEIGDEANISVFDSFNLSGAQRFQVLAAARAAISGWSLQRTLERLQEIRANSETIFTLETLDYLARGGRIGRVAGLLGHILKIKPIIHVDHKDGKYTTTGKTRTLPQALDIIIEFLSDKYGTTPLWINLMHGRLQHMADNLAGLLKENLNISRLDILRVSPVLGVHTGPGVVGVSVVPMELMQDLI
jgi:DegV family protein with EDD domain